MFGPDGESGQSCGVLELEWATIEATGYRGIPYPEIRCPDGHLADAEVISLGLSFSGNSNLLRTDLKSGSGGERSGIWSGSRPGPKNIEQN